MGFINSGRKTPESVVAKYAASSGKERAEMLMRLADHNVVLTPVQFAKLAEFPVTSGYISCLQDLFGKIAQFPNRDGLYNQMRPYCIGASFAVYEPAAWFPASAKMTKQGSYQRVIDLAADGIADPGRSMPKLRKLASAEQPTAAEWTRAVEYALYKIAAVSRVKSDDSDSHRLAVLQQFL